jgi:endonuclease YncB( thermonuclease family)
VTIRIRRAVLAGIAACALLAAPAALAQAPAPERADSGRAQNNRATPKPQARPHSKRVAIDPAQVRVGDGDTVTLDWGAEGRETVRILGIDTPETEHTNYDMPYPQSFGHEARAFARGAFAAASQVELLRAPMTDPYGRTLGYLFLNGRNYSALAIRARLAEESITKFGDNGFPEQAAEVLQAARESGPMPFESPAEHRRRMRAVSEWMKQQGARAAD